MSYKAIIFDMDGTITDTEQLWHNAFAKMLEVRGIRLDRAEREKMIAGITGLGLGDKCRFIKDSFCLLEPLEELTHEKLTVARQLYDSNIRLMDGFTDFHRKLGQRNLKSGVATNADEETLSITKKKLGLEKFFGDHIYGIANVGNVGKPDPTIYLFVAHRLGVDPSNCIAIEDSAAGIAAAKGAGMFCIGLDPTRTGKQVAQADMTTGSYGEIDLDGLLSSTPSV